MKTKIFQLTILLLACVFVFTTSKLVVDVKARSNVTDTDISREINLNEVMFYPDEGEYEWVELKNNGSVSLDIKGYRLTDEDGNSYTIPDALPEVPAGDFVVVVFDGAGSSNNDYDFSDHVATLHSQAGLVNIFEDDVDQVSFYGIKRTFLPIIFNNLSALISSLLQGLYTDNSSTIISFVAWGAYNSVWEDARNAVLVGLWSESTYIQTEQAPGHAGLEPNGSIGLLPAQQNSNNWQIYMPLETTRGSDNGIPGPTFYNPPDGIETCEHQMTFGWSHEGDQGYHLDVDDQNDFSSPLISTDVSVTSYQPSPFTDGTYYFRVKSLNSNSNFSKTNSVTFVSCSQTTSAPSSEALLNVTPILQHKDTRMVNLDGAINSSGNTETGSSRWDSSHEDDGDWVIGNGSPVRVTAQDDSYSTQASIAMIVAYYDGYPSLSQDRISYAGLSGSKPEGGLGANKGLWPNEILSKGNGRYVFSWAMNGSVITSTLGKPTYNQLKGWIDGGSPILAVENDGAQSVVIDGYRETLPENQVHRIDTYTATSAWVAWESWNITEYHVPYSVVHPYRDEDSDADGETDVIDDSDGDGLCDFDEINRFETDRTNPDSDNDGVPDKLDIREYVFDNDGNFSYQKPDIDNDGLRKEMDADNDNGGSKDGCEDSNQNGKYEPDLVETSNFKSGEERPCLVSPEMIYISVGTFWRGCDEAHNNGEPCSNQTNELPLRAITLSAYSIDKYEVTNGQYAQCVAAGACTALGYNGSWTRSSYYDNWAYVNYPVILVTWQQAKDYCLWAGKRLPTEAEWEMAARGTGRRAFPWGDTTPSCSLMNNWDNGTQDYCVGDTTQVGSYPTGASPYGAMDMAGNVLEWVNDWFGETYYGTSPSNDPPGPTSGTYRVMRGGGFMDWWYSCRVAERWTGVPTDGAYNRGFRCAKTP